VICREWVGQNAGVPKAEADGERLKGGAAPAKFAAGDTTNPKTKRPPVGGGDKAHTRKYPTRRLGEKLGEITCWSSGATPSTPLMVSIAETWNKGMDEKASKEFL